LNQITGVVTDQGVSALITPRRKWSGNDLNPTRLQYRNRTIEIVHPESGLENAARQHLLRGIEGIFGCPAFVVLNQLASRPLPASKG
jgi:hypothetical protein